MTSSGKVAAASREAGSDARKRQTRVVEYDRCLIFGRLWLDPGTMSKKWGLPRGSEVSYATGMPE
jgi:hypothetical protein